MNSSPIVHEWFYSGGPDTFEYLLPVERFANGHESALSQWTLGFASLSLADAKQSFAEYVDSINHPEVSAFINVIQSLTPYSIVVHESDSWLLCKIEDQFGESSAHGNMLQLSAPHLNVEWPSFFDSENFTPLKHFLKYFGGTRIDIPPTCGTVTPNCLNPVSEDPETCAWKNIGTWDGTYPVYHVGNGDVVLVRSDGIYGTWSHELGNDPNGAVNVLGSFAEFVQYVATETGVV